MNREAANARKLLDQSELRNSSDSAEHDQKLSLIRRVTTALYGVVHRGSRHQAISSDNDDFIVDSNKNIVYANRIN